MSDQGWDIHLFPAYEAGFVHSDLKNVTVHHIVSDKARKNPCVKEKGVSIKYRIVAENVRKIMEICSENYNVVRLKRVITKIKPDIIHSLEFQHASYLTLEAKKLIKGYFPPWIVTNWGSDIYLYGKLAVHEPKILELLSECNYYSCECNRDVALARMYGFKGEVLPVFPNTGGFNVEGITQYRESDPVSSRKIIMLKGYQGLFGRALVGFRALERCMNLLNGYEIVIFSWMRSEGIKETAELFTKSTGIKTKLIKQLSHQEMLKLFGKSRLYIGLSISDAISTTMLEAMSMGAFPIQSNTSCANEWIEDGKTGLLVPPSDPEIVEKAIRRALTDDELINRAAEINLQTIREKCDQSKIKPKVIETYKKIYMRHSSMD